MTYEIVKEFPNDIIYERQGPCISLYQPTHRYRPENKQDIIRFKNLAKDIEESLLKLMDKQEVEKIMKKFYEIENDKIFWNNAKDGLAILANKEKMIVYKLSRPVPEIAVVSDSFHIKPLVRVFQSADNYFVLGINMKQFKLFAGNRYGLQEVLFDEDTPITMDDVIGKDRTEPFLTQRTSGPDATIFHGHGGKKDEISKDVERYFRYVDRLILEDFSRPTKTPLLLVALNEHQGTFRDITHNNYLLKEGISLDYETLSIDQLKDKSWDIIEPFYLKRTKELVESYELKVSKEQGTQDLAEGVRAALSGRVAYALIESDRVIPGKIDKENKKMVKTEETRPGVDDLLDDLAELVLQNDGEVIMLPKERMPSDSGLALIYRF